MAEQLYDIEFEFEYENGSSDNSLFFHALTAKTLDNLLLKFSFYGEVPEIKYAGDNVKVNQTFIINLFKPETAKVWFKIHYNFTLYSVEEIVEHVNNGLIQFIRESKELEGFL